MNNHVDTLKQSIEFATKTSKETIHQIITTATEQFDATLKTNEKIIESIEKQFSYKESSNSSLVSEIKKSYSIAIELSEEAIDSIIDIHNRQLQSIIDTNMMLLEMIRNLNTQDKEAINELIKAIESNIETTSNQSIENTKRIIDIYNKHLNLSFNFNEFFLKNMNGRLHSFNRVQNKNMEMFTDWAAHWWRDTSKEAEAVTA